MEKSIFSKGYTIFLQRLREAREDADLTQGKVAARLRKTQSFVSKCERGERRIDVIELRSFCKAIGISYVDFVRSLDAELN
jgi:transcriptional regulator with XRE-family HTH domain